MKAMDMPLQKRIERSLKYAKWQKKKKKTEQQWLV